MLLTCTLTVHATSPPDLNVNHVPKLPKYCGRRSYDILGIYCMFQAPKSGTTLNFLRQPQIKTAVLGYFGGSQPEDGMFFEMPNLERVNVFGCFKKRFTHKFFEGLIGVRSLTIRTRNCSITFTPDWLTPLSSLQGLTLNGNNIANFPAETFCNAHSLIYLDISNNKLNDSEAIGINCVGGEHQRESCHPCLPNLSFLDISHNSISILNISMSRDLPRLQHLLMTNSNLSKLIVDGKAIDMLVELDLSNNLLSSFMIDDIEKCNGSHLKTLKLGNNQIDFITKGFFLCTEYLTYLDISSNIISNATLIEAGIPFLRKLEYLNCNDNKIHILQATLIGNLTNLTNLSCSRCAIEMIEKDAFLQLTKLQVLTLNSNAITNIDGDIFVHLPNLILLDLSDNDLITFEVKDGFPSLKSLYLSRNNMQAPPALRPTLSQINILDLSRNNITEMSSSMQCCPKLKELNLAFNNIKTIDTYTFVGQVEMETLNLSNNAIDTIELNSYSSNLIGGRRIETNQVLQKDGSPLLLQSLKYLDLSRNFIPNLGVGFKLNSLEWMDLSLNEISYIDNDMFSANIQIVNLTYNRLYHLNVSSLEMIVGNTRPQVLLEGNLLHCDCHNELITTMNSNM